MFLSVAFTPQLTDFSCLDKLKPVKFDGFSETKKRYKLEMRIDTDKYSQVSPLPVSCVAAQH
jgi:hypothetical protein